jgi:serine/threonine protein phosphatase 1
MKVLKLNSGQGRTFIIGDLHGYYNALMDTLSELNFDHAIDRVISVGDIVDRGPQSLECVSLLDEPWFYCVTGNHEDMIRMGYALYQNGAQWCSDLSNTESQFVLDHFDALPDAIVLDDRIAITHAAMPPGFFYQKDFSLEKNFYGHEITRRLSDEVFIYWNRTEIFDDCVMPHFDLTVHGHTKLKSPMLVKNRLYIDTGLASGNSVLSVFEVGANVVHQFKWNKQSEVIESVVSSPLSELIYTSPKIRFP